MTVQRNHAMSLADRTPLKVVAWLSTIALLLLSPLTAYAAEPSLEAAANRLVTVLQKTIESDPLLATTGSAKKVFVGDFVGVGTLSVQSGGGTGLAEKIAGQFKKLGFQITPAAPLHITGKFRIVSQKEFQTDAHESPGLEIKAEILDQNGKSLLIVDPFVTFSREAIQVSGPNIEVPLDVDEATQSKIINEQLQAPQTTIREESQVAPTPDSRFAMEIVVKGKARAATLQEDTQLPFVEMTKGEEYVVRLHNRSDFAVGVRLMIDGVSMFVDSKDAPPDSLVIVGPGKVVEIQGWWISAQGSSAMKAFEVGEAAESVAMRVKAPTSKIGTISASFHAAWPSDGRPPQDERLAGKNSLGTKQGRDLSQNNQVRKNLIFGACRSIITIRYDRS